jgi:hypothetical protein
MGEEEPKFRLLFTLYKNFLFADSLYVPFFASRSLEGAAGRRGARNSLLRGKVFKLSRFEMGFFWGAYKTVRKKRDAVRKTERGMCYPKRE